jgi:hypothetical protein
MTIEAWMPESPCNNCTDTSGQCSYTRRTYDLVAGTAEEGSEDLLNLRLDVTLGLIRELGCEKSFDEIYKELEVMDGRV